MTETMTDMTLAAVTPQLEYEREFDALNRLLRGELSAVETYTQALANVDDWLKADLGRLRESHRIRSEQLHNHIALMGGEPSGSSGVWGAFALLVESGATLISEQKTLEALEIGELHGVRQYRDIADLRPSTRAFVRRHLRPEQERTYAALGELIGKAQAA